MLYPIAFGTLPGEQIFYPASEESFGEDDRRVSVPNLFFGLLQDWFSGRPESRARIDRSHLAPAPPRFSLSQPRKEHRGRQLDFCPPAVIHFSTHTRKVKMAALTVSFAGKIGATAPRVANARAAGEFPSAPRAPDASAPPSRPAKSPPFRPSGASWASLRRTPPAAARRRERRRRGGASQTRRSWTLERRSRRGRRHVRCARDSIAIPGVAPPRPSRPRRKKPRVIHRGAGAIRAVTRVSTRAPTRPSAGSDPNARRLTRARARPLPRPPGRVGAAPAVRGTPLRVKSASSARVASATPFASPRPPPRPPSAFSSWSMTSPRTTPPSPRTGRSP